MPHDPLDSETRPFTFIGARLRPARGLRWAFGLMALLAALVTATCIGLPELRWAMGIFGALLVVPMGVGLFQLRKNIPRSGGELEVRDEGVYIERRLALPRETLVRAVVTGDARGVTVAIERRKGFVSVVDVGSAEEGQALVKALGLDATQALSTFVFDSLLAARLPSWSLYLFLALLLPLALPPLLFGFAWMAVPLVFTWYASLLGGAMPTRLAIGLDGLLIRWLWRRELIRFEDLRAIAHDGDRIHLSLADGNERWLSVKWMAAGIGTSSGGETGFGSRAAYLDAVVARVREAVAASRERIGRLPAAALLRKGRELDAWVRALRGLLKRGASGFREAETVPEHLWGTVEDGSAAPATRAAAAIALGPTLDDAERQRLRGVARVIVSPRLRVAIEAAVDGDEESVREALAELEEDGGERSRRTT